MKKSDTLWDFFLKENWTLQQMEMIKWMGEEEGMSTWLWNTELFVELSKQDKITLLERQTFKL